MQIETSREGEVTVLRPVGPIDSTVSVEFEHAVMALAGLSGARLVIDLGRVDYVSSAGLRVFLMAAKALKAGGGRFVVCGMAEVVRKVFQLSGFLRIMTVVADEAEALAAVG